MLAHVTRAKAQFEKATRSLKSQLDAELDAANPNGKSDGSHKLAEDQ
jgi:hypothetical protein